jgi:hypothetical protein
MIRFLVVLKKYPIAIFLFSISSFILNAQTTVNTISELRALSPGISQTVMIRGYYEPDDDGGGIFRWDASSIEQDNFGTIIRPDVGGVGRWKRDYSGFNYINVLWFGARGDDQPNDINHVRFQIALDYAVISLKAVYIPVGIYQFRGQAITLDGNHSGLKISGVLNERINNNGFRIVDSDNSSILKFADSDNNATRLLYLGGRIMADVRIMNLAFDGNSSNNGWNILVYHRGDIDAGATVVFENIISFNGNYGMRVSGNNVILDNILVYDIFKHGIGGQLGGFLESKSNSIVRNLEVRNASMERGYYGFNFAGLGARVEAYNIKAHYCNQGMKTSARYLKIDGGTFNNNEIVGLRTRDGLENIYLDNIVAENNGDAGLWLTPGIKEGTYRRAGKLIVRNNTQNEESESWNALISHFEIDKLIVENANKNGRSEAVAIFGNTIINYIRSENNEVTGVLIRGENVIINSGRIFNNSDIGIEIYYEVNSLSLFNLEFGDNRNPPRQTKSEIYGLNSSINYGNLNFDESQVEIENRILVNNAQEIPNAILVLPRDNQVFYMESDDILVEAIASAPNMDVVKIEFFANDLLIGAVSEKPYIFNWVDMEVGKYTINAVATFTDNSQVTSNVVTITIRSRTKTQSIHLHPGWNTISTYVIPEPNDISPLLTDIEDNLLLVSSQSGSVYWPLYEINDINEWDPHQGYQIFMNERDTLNVTGLQILPEDSPVALTKGWNLIAFFLEEPLPIETAFDGISHSIELVSNNDGNIFWPAIGVNSIGEMQPGEGYRIFALENVSLVYPNTSQNSIALSTSQVGDLQKLSSITSERYKSNRINTGINAILFVESDSFIDGDEIAIWSESNNLLGSGIANGGKVAITVWGKNEIIPDQEFGALPNEKLRLTFWSAADEREYELIVDRLSIVGKGIQDNTDLRFHANTINLLQVSIEDEIPMRYSLVQNFPNPFNPSTTIRYNIPREEKVKLEVYNLLGQKVETLVDDVHHAGSYEIIFKAGHLASGVYFYRLSAGNFSEVMRMILLR